MRKISRHLILALFVLLSITALNLDVTAEEGGDCIYGCASANPADPCPPNPCPPPKEKPPVIVPGDKTESSFLISGVCF